MKKGDMLVLDTFEVLQVQSLDGDDGVALGIRTQSNVFALRLTSFVIEEMRGRLMEAELLLKQPKGNG